MWNVFLWQAHFTQLPLAAKQSVRRLPTDMYFRARIREAQQTPDQTITLRQVNQPKQERALSNTMELSHSATEGLSLFSRKTQTRIFLIAAHVELNFATTTSVKWAEKRWDKRNLKHSSGVLKHKSKLAGCSIVGKKKQFLICVSQTSTGVYPNPTHIRWRQKIHPRHSLSHCNRAKHACFRTVG